MSTITLSSIPDFTASVSPPRVAAIEHPPGRPFGQPGDADTQRAVIRATLDALATIATPGQVVHLPFVWPEPVRDVHWHPRTAPPITKLCKRKPWNYLRLVKGNFP